MRAFSLLWVICSAALWASCRQQSCQPIAGHSSLGALEQEGDITLGGLFSLHDSVLEPDLTFGSRPAPTRCSG